MSSFVFARASPWAYGVGCRYSPSEHQRSSFSLYSLLHSRCILQIPSAARMYVQTIISYPESAFNNFQKILQFFVVLIIDLEAKQQIKHQLIS